MMPELTLYEYAVVRLVPRVEREEFINIGVILYCKKYKYAHFLYTISEKRIRNLCTEIELDLVAHHLQSFFDICTGAANGGRLATLDTPDRFRWLTAKRSTIVQCSAVHPGLCEDPEQTLHQLFERLVL